MPAFPFARTLRLAALIATFTGCAGRLSTLEQFDRTAPEEYRGHYITASGSWFRPCGAAATDSSWWVTITGAAVAQVDSARRAKPITPATRLFVQWRGVATRSGVVGPPGGTALLVRELLSLRAPSDGDCARP